MPLDFQLAGGSVAGKEHRKGIPRNRQDAFHVEQTAHGITAVVADGCGSGEDSEVGAAIAVRLTTTHLHHGLARGYEPGSELLGRVRQAVLSQLHVLAQSMGESLSEVVNRYFLFTLGGAILTEKTATFFFLGDGVLIINGEVIVLDSGPENEPIYLAYALIGSTLTDGDPSSLDFQLVRQQPTATLNHFLVGTDGVRDVISRAHRCLPGSDELVGPISQFWDGNRFFNPGSTAVKRRLNLMARDWPRQTATGRQVVDGGLLPDDTTFVVGRRPPQEE